MALLTNKISIGQLKNNRRKIFVLLFIFLFLRIPNILKIPEINLDVGQEYIEYLLKLKSVNNNLIYLTAAYNGGPGNLQKWQNNINYLDDPLFFMESIPSRETRWFIEKILTKYWIYQNKNQKEMTSLKMLANGKDPLY